MALRGRKVKEIISKYESELKNMGITPQKVILFGSYAANRARRDSDIDLLVISSSFKGMSLRKRLELLGLAAGRIFEPIEALGYTNEELKNNKKETFLEEILAHGHVV